MEWNDTHEKTFLNGIHKRKQNTKWNLKWKYYYPKKSVDVNFTKLKSIYQFTDL